MASGGKWSTGAKNYLPDRLDLPRACTWTRVHWRPFAHADPLHRRNLRSAVHVAYLRSNLLYVHVHFFFLLFFLFFLRPSARFFIAASFPLASHGKFQRVRASTFLLDAKQKIAMIGDRLKFQSSVASRAAISYLSLPRVACRREYCAPRFRARFYLFRNCISMLMSFNTLTAIIHTTGVRFLFLRRVRVIGCHGREIKI